MRSVYTGKMWMCRGVGAEIEEIELDFEV